MLANRFPTLNDAIEWIAENDEDANVDDLESLSAQVAVLMAADLFEVDPEALALAVMDHRKELLRQHLADKEV